jgi:hypothetical protein
MQVIEVENNKLDNIFLQMPLSIYKHDAAYIQPLHKDITAVFSPSENKFFKQGECKRWLLLKDNHYIGRIAAFTNKKYKQQQPTGGIGFFECIHDQQAANLLFDTAKNWLQTKE